MYKLTPFQFKYQDFTGGKSTRQLFSTNEITLPEKGLVLVSGPSGSGKSTFLNLLKGIVPHFIPGTLEGEIYFYDKKFSAENMEAFNNQIVYLFQNPFSQIIQNNVELEFAFTQENLKYDRSYYLQKKEELGKLFNIKHLWNEKTTNLSNGECQKLVLASLVATDPKVILLDEPTAFLDPQTRSEIYHILNQLKQKHLIVIVDHHVEEVRSIVDHSLYVDSNGEVAFREIKLENIDVEKKRYIQNEKNKSLKVELSAKDIHFNYSSARKILQGINFRASEGDVIIIKGKNGEGKSTLFKVLTGILSPVKGNVQITLNSKKVQKEKWKKIIGFVFQNPESCFFYNTLKEELQGGDQTLIRSFFSEEDLNRSPFLFSEGQKRRISILINLILDKKIIFYDEPTFGQDTNNIEKIKNIINELKTLNKLQFIISHDEKFIKEVGTCVYELNQGVLNEIE